MILIRVFCAALAILLLAGCVQPTTSQQTAQIKSLSIITGFGEQIELIFTGVTVFTNKRQSASVDWQIDRHFKQKAAAELGGRYQLQEIPYNPANLRESRRELLGPDPAIALVQSIAKSGMVDAIIYFGPAEYEDMLGHSTQHVSGLGLYGRSRLGIDQIHNYVFAAWRAILFDGKTLQPIGQVAALTPFEMSNIITLRARIPHADIEIAVPERYDALSGGQRTRLQEKIFELVNQFMPQVLTEMKLR
jgi:hypothetical protein